jgi:hypothetical protein
MNSTEKGVIFLRRILTLGSHFYVEKLPRGQYSTGVTSLRYIRLLVFWLIFIRIDPAVCDCSTVLFDYRMLRNYWCVD